MNKIGFILLALLSLGCAQEWVSHYTNFHTKEFKDQDGWVYTNSASNNVFYTCSGQQVFGGPLAFGTRATLARSFKLPAHYQVKINVRLWKIKSWDYERMILYADGFQWETLWGHADEGSNLCGAGGGPKDNTYDIEFKFPHSQSALSLVFTSTLDQAAADESWGISHFTLSYQACPPECGTCRDAQVDKCFFWQPQFWSWFDFNGPADKGDWQIENGKLEKTECAGIPIYGGPHKIGSGTQLSKVIQGLPPHFRILVQFQFWKIDSWDNEQAQLYIDRELSWYQSFSFSDGIELCYGAGDASPEKVVNVNHEIPHVFSAVNLRFTSTLNEGMDNESWGIRQFFLHVGKCAENCIECHGPLPADCSVCVAPFVMKGGQCVIQGDWQEVAKDFNSDSFTEATGWVVKNVFKDSTEFVTECGGVSMLGGFEKFGAGAIVSRKFKKLPPHKRLRLTIEVWKIDNWNGEDLWIKLDGNIVWKQVFGWADPGSMDVCGTTKPDSGAESKVRVDVVIGHDKPNTEFIIGSSLTKDAFEQSWAFRDFALYYEAADDCATLFTECEFLGESFDLCDQNPNFQLNKIPSQIKSIQVPKDSTVVLYDESDYAGLKVEYTSSQNCITDYKFSLAQLQNVSEKQPEKHQSKSLAHQPKKV